MLRNLALIVTCLFCASAVSAQETLPKFSVVLAPNGKVIISWKNNYAVVNQISIQRSTDSLKNFTTLLTVPNASVAENGFVDAKAPGPRIFYRLFIVLDSGKYIFTKSKRPAADTVVAKQKNVEEGNDITLSRAERQRLSYIEKNTDNVAVNAPDKIKEKPAVKLEKIYFIKKQDTVVGQLFEKSIRKFRDSILSKTKDTLVFKDADTILINPFIPKEVYKVSAYVFTTKDGNVSVSVPDADKKNYAVKFLEIDGTEIFQLKQIKQSQLIVDKTNFVHAGWFRFELYEDGKLKEKNKLFIPKEF